MNVGKQVEWGVGMWVRQGAIDASMWTGERGCGFDRGQIIRAYGAGSGIEGQKGG